MKLDDIKLLVREKYNLQMFDEGKENYTLMTHDNKKVGVVQLIEGTKDEYRLDIDSLKLKTLHKKKKRTE